MIENRIKLLKYFRIVSYLMIKIINSLKKYDIVFAIGIMTLLLTATTTFGVSSQFSNVMAQGYSKV